MVLLNGKELRKIKLKELKEKVETLNELIGLAVVQVGNDEASNVYIGQKEKLANSLGYYFVHKNFDENITNEELLNEIDKLNKNDQIDGIIVQMPLPKQIDSINAVNRIDKNKDVDGLGFINAGKLMHGKESLVSCTPKGIIDLLDYYDIPIEGKHVVIVGRSILVGKPLSNLFTNRNATVTLCHSKTIDLQKYTKEADILVAAVGKKHFITENMVKEGAVVIDVGINREDNKLYGDVDFDNVSQKASFITPVPGGIGPMTVYELMDNTYKAHMLRKKS